MAHIRGTIDGAMPLSSQWLPCNRKFATLSLVFVFGEVMMGLARISSLGGKGSLASFIGNAHNPIQQQRGFRSLISSLLVDQSINGSPWESLTQSSRSMATMPNKQLVVNKLPKKLVDVEYSVRGPIVTRSLEIEGELKKNPGKYPFDEVIPANIGNPQVVGQLPLTFHRQVLACLLDPSLLSSISMPVDVKARVSRYLSMQPVGAYSHSKGVLGLRMDVAQWLERRDGFPADPEDIFLTNGASSAVSLILEALIATPTDGILIPTPQYPLYSSTITRLGGTAVGYYLEEENGWGVNVSELRAALGTARKAGTDVKALVVINPGNPTGTVLTRPVMEELVRFCEAESLLLMADEVYQDNIYGEVPFTPFRKVVRELNSAIELVSFHSASKGYYGECGLRGGLMHLENIDPEATAQLYKLASTSLCANTVGQTMMASLVDPPKPGDESYAVFIKEKQDILGGLERKAQMVYKMLNAIPGVSVQRVTGAMYAFPRLDLPPLPTGGKADEAYCMKLLEETGLVTVSGSGFGQRPGTNHLRLTILPQEEKLPKILEAFADFHKRYTGGYTSETVSQ